jgi:hypothetical protein
VDVRTPDVRGPQPDRLELLQLVEEVENETAVDLVEMLRAESALQIAQQVGAADIPARSQLFGRRSRALLAQPRSTSLTTNPEFPPPLT